MTELLGQVPFDLISLGLLGALGLRRLVLMERLHWPRVVIFTALLWVLAFYLFLLSWPPLPESDCVPDDGSSGFTIHANLGRRSPAARVSL